MKYFGQKSTGIILFVLFAFVASAMPSRAAVLSMLDVGQIDNFLGHCNNAQPSAAQEIQCFENYAGVGNVAAIQKFVRPGEQQGDEIAWTSHTVQDGNTILAYAYELPEQWRGAYFLLKVGSVGGSYIFENLSSLAYAVFTLDDPDYQGQAPNIRNFDAVSHITAVQLIATPLPAAVWMFGAALGGLFGLRRFRRT